MQDLIKKIKALKEKINSIRPLNKGELTELKKWYDISYTYHSNAIEGNSLTMEETRIVIEDGLTINGKPLREINEAINHKHGIDLLYKLAKKNTDINEKSLKEMHKLILSNIDDENAGKYRNVQVYISGEDTLPPKASDIHNLMDNLFNWLASSQEEKGNPLFIAAKWHYDFVKIHPFIDGNGRTARLMSNVLLMQNGYPIQIIPIVRRPEYIASLKSKKTFDDFYRFFLETQYENMKDYLRMIEQ